MKKALINFCTPIELTPHKMQRCFQEIPEPKYIKMIHPWKKNPFSQIKEKFWLWQLWNVSVTVYAQNLRWAKQVQSMHSWQILAQNSSEDTFEAVVHFMPTFLIYFFCEVFQSCCSYFLLNEKGIPYLISSCLQINNLIFFLTLWRVGFFMPPTLNFKLLSL